MGCIEVMEGHWWGIAKLLELLPVTQVLSQSSHGVKAQDKQI